MFLICFLLQNASKYHVLDYKIGYSNTTSIYLSKNICKNDILYIEKGD